MCMCILRWSSFQNPGCWEAELAQGPGCQRAVCTLPRISLAHVKERQPRLRQLHPSFLWVVSPPTPPPRQSSKTQRSHCVTLSHRADFSGPTRETSRFCASTSLNMDILAMLCCPWRIRGGVSHRRSAYSNSVDGGGETLVLCTFVFPLTGCLFSGRYGKRWPA